MIADITGFVYCEHREYIQEEAPRRWDYPKSREVTCNKRAEVILRVHSHRGKDQIRVVSFVTFVSTGWVAWVDSEGSCRVYCSEHRPKHVEHRYLVES